MATFEEAGDRGGKVGKAGNGAGSRAKADTAGEQRAIPATGVGD